MENTKFGSAAVRALLRGRTRIHFIGIGGIHMSALALLCRARGMEVSGSDRCEGAQTAQLRRAGICVYIGHSAAHVADCDAVVYTLAISPQNPEYQAAICLGVPVISRAELLGACFAISSFCVCHQASSMSGLNAARTLHSQKSYPRSRIMATFSTAEQHAPKSIRPPFRAAHSPPTSAPAAAERPAAAAPAGG